MRKLPVNVNVRGNEGGGGLLSIYIFLNWFQISLLRNENTVVTSNKSSQKKMNKKVVWNVDNARYLYSFFAHNLLVFFFVWFTFSNSPYPQSKKKNNKKVVSNVDNVWYFYSFFARNLLVFFFVCFTFFFKFTLLS